MDKDMKIFVMVITGALCFIQVGAWYMGFDGQVTVAITGLITYLVGYVSKEGIDKVFFVRKK